MKYNEEINFLRKKSYLFQKEIGQGGTGRTILVKDDLIDEFFVCKKYSPYYPEQRDKYFDYFLEEIRLLHQLSHKNVVRVFNYYLYPEETTGYILMEFIEGPNLAEFAKANPSQLSDLFLQVIDGFRHLEERGILHRDIRPENILVTTSGVVKIIDFGFGKFVDPEGMDKSISLNWRYEVPDEFSNSIYDIKTDIYFVGKMFEELLSILNVGGFRFSDLVTKMTSNYQFRPISFFSIYRETIEKKVRQEAFTKAEMNIYRDFASKLVNHIASVNAKARYETDIPKIVHSMNQLHRASILETHIQNNHKLISIFLDGEYRYWKDKLFPVSIFAKMLTLLNSSSDDRRQLILNNLWERLDAISRAFEVPDDDLPF